MGSIWIHTITARSVESMAAWLVAVPTIASFVRKTFHQPMTQCQTSQNVMIAMRGLMEHLTTIETVPIAWSMTKDRMGHRRSKIAWHAAQGLFTEMKRPESQAVSLSALLDTMVANNTVQEAWNWWLNAKNATKIAMTVLVDREDISVQAVPRVNTLSIFRPMYLSVTVEWKLCGRPHIRSG
jgi:tRNA(Phe) wybutosine-synthesizing methylase Tyw3